MVIDRETRRLMLKWLAQKKREKTAQIKACQAERRGMGTSVDETESILERRYLNRLSEDLKKSR